ncbi:EamA family transporter [Candidatus Woesearchaeota archaeon]|jgi:drug/metabolite transporter (DMT)-like permease|nr:EamA family transporter [Candidatus Woesearchaeota archaeon]
METALWAIGIMVVVSLLSAVATFFLKLASKDVSLNLKKLIKNWKLFLGVVFYGIGTLLALVAFRGGELSVLYPFVALQYIWANILSKKYLDEKISVIKWLGIVLIFIGVSLIGTGA